jgi:transposase-like protein
MTKVLSLKLKDSVFKNTETVVKELKIPRNTYINNAIELFNRLNQRKALRKKLADESRLVRNESLAVLEEMESLEDTLP